MALISKSDLKYECTWTATRPNNPKVTGIPDSVLLNRGEGDEALPFINKFAITHKFKRTFSDLKTSTESRIIFLVTF